MFYEKNKNKNKKPTTNINNVIYFVEGLDENNLFRLSSSIFQSL